MTIGSNSSGHLFDTSFTTDGVLYSAANGVITSTAAGTATNVLTSNGPGVAPTFQAAGGGGVTGPGSSTDRAIATWNGTGGTALFNNSTAKIDSTGRMTNSAQPAFLAYVSSNTGNVTGDGTPVNFVPFNAVIFDQGSNYNTGTNAYVCPVTGIYQYNVNLFLAQSGAGTNTTYTVNLYVNQPTTVYQLINSNTYSIVTVGFVNVNASILIQNTAGDIIQVQTIVSGNASKNIVIGGGAGAQYTSMSGFLVC